MAHVGKRKMACWKTRQLLEKCWNVLSSLIRKVESKQPWLAAVELWAEDGEFAVARELLIRARMVADTERVSSLFISFISSLHFI